MEVLYWLIPMGVILVVLALAVLFWAIRNGQYEDLEGPAHRILWDDEDRPKKPENHP
jgi:cbb3-type cytochrome oxidase maturation protein